MEIYFDNASTTMVCEAAAQTALEMMCENYANPSSMHSMGMRAEKALKLARSRVAGALGVDVGGIYFTSGGTEADNLAIFGAAAAGKKRGNTLITSKMEHPAVLGAFAALEQQGFQVEYVDVLPDGVLDLESLRRKLSPDVILVSIMHVNNETGTVQPIEEIAGMIREKAPGALIHSDMVQSFCKIDCTAAVRSVDLASISAHKIHAPKGTGALYVRPGVHLRPRQFGGGQERDMRPGTENLPGIAAFGKAADIAAHTLTKHEAHMRLLRENLKKLVLENVDKVHVNGDGSGPHILNLSFEGAKSEVLLHILESNGIMVSSGSACSSNKPAPSQTLSAMGASPALVDSAIRFSFSRYNTLEEVERCAQILKKEVPILRKYFRK